MRLCYYGNNKIKSNNPIPAQARSSQPKTNPNIIAIYPKLEPKLTKGTKKPRIFINI